MKVTINPYIKEEYIYQEEVDILDKEIERNDSKREEE